MVVPKNSLGGTLMSMAKGTLCFFFLTFLTIDVQGLTKWTVPACKGGPYPAGKRFFVERQSAWVISIHKVAIYYHA